MTHNTFLRLFLAAFGLCVTTASPVVAQEGRWQFATDAERIIGSSDLVRADGRPLLALRCLTPSLSVAARLAHPSAVGRIAPNGLLAVLMAPDLLADPTAVNSVVIRAATGAAETLRVAVEQPDNVPMAPISAGSSLFTALANGGPVALEVTGATPVALSAPGLADAIRQLSTHCGFPLQPQGSPPVAPALTPFAGPTDTVTSGQAAPSLPSQATQGQTAQTAPGAGQSVVMPTADTLLTAAWTDQDRFNTEVLLWALGQLPEFAQGNSLLIDRVLTKAALPPGYPAYPAAIDTKNRSADFTANQQQNKAWLESVVATAAALPAPPPSRYLFEETVYSYLENDRWHVRMGGRRVQHLGEAVNDMDITIRRIRHELPVNSLLAFEMTETEPMPLTIPDQLIPRLQDDRNSPSFMLRAAITLSDQATGVQAGRAARNSSTMFGADMRVEQVVLHEVIRTGNTFEAGPAIHVWNRADMQPPPAQPTLDPSSPDPVMIGDIYGTSLLDGRMLTNLHLDGGFGRDELFRTQPSRFDRAGFVADRQAEFAMRLAAVLRASQDRPLSPPLAMRVAKELLTQAERDRLLPLRIFDRNYTELERDVALRAADAELKAAVLRIGIAGEVPAVELKRISTRTWDRAAGGIPVSGGQTERLWFGEAEPPVTYPNLLPMTEEQALQLLRIQQNDGTDNALISRVDYIFGPATALIGRMGPIEERELAGVRIAATPNRVALFADLAMTIPLYQADSAPPPSARGAPLPPEVALTTPDSMLATYDWMLPEDRRAQSRLLEEAEGAVQRQNLPESQRAAAFEVEVTRLRGLAREELWLSWPVALGAYDEAKSGFPIINSQGMRVPISGIDHLDVVEPLFARKEQATFLPVPPAHRADVEGLVAGHYLHTLVRMIPASVIESDRGHLALTPAEFIVGPLNRDRLVASVTLRLPWPEPKQAQAAVVAPVDAPEKLILDPEALDLIVLAKAPELYNDTAIERMLIERLARERAAPEGATLPWGRFFADPTLGLPPQARRALLPAFRAWSEARAAQLPKTVVMASGMDRRDRSGHVPDCGGLRQMDAPRGHPVETVVDDVLGTGTLERFRQAAIHRASNPYAQEARAIGPFAFTLHDRPFFGSNLSAELCPSAEQSLRRGRGAEPFSEGFDALAAGHADLILIADGHAHHHPMARGLFISHEIPTPNVGVRPVRPAADGAPGLVAAVVIGGAVERISALQAGVLNEPPKEVEVWSAAAQEALRAKLPDATDILGLTLGTDRATFETQAAALYSAPVRVTLQSRQPGVFGDAFGFFDPDQRELLIGLTPSGLPDGPIIAIMRAINFSEGTATQEALVAQLSEKYGPPAAKGEGAVARMDTWGLPNNSIDRRGSCGGRMHGQSRPGNFELPDVPAEEAAAQLRALNPLSGQGWPSESDLNAAGIAGSATLDECGPALVAIFDAPAATSMTLWLVDMKAASATRDLPRLVPDMPKIRL
ncbi:MAG: hypothetical protein ACK4HF_14060 [Paracoccaceae bacterium]